MLTKAFVLPIAGALTLVLSAQAFALNPQPLPPRYHGYYGPHYRTMVRIIPPACRGPVRSPNPCK